MSIIEKQLKTNRQNAQKSTGPKTEEGKKISRHNAVKHGFFATSAVINSPRIKENQEEYDQLRKSIHKELKPKGVLQTHLVQKIVDCLWRYRRAINAEKSAVGGNQGDRKKAAFKRFFEAGGLNRPVKKFVVSEWEDNTPEESTIPTGDIGLNLWRYEMRIDRQLHRAYRLLRILQKSQNQIDSGEK